MTLGPYPFSRLNAASRPEFMRPAIIAIWAAFGMLVSAPLATAGSPDDPMLRATRLAYDAARKCYVAGGNAHADMVKVGNKQKADYYYNKARQSFNLAFNAGEKLGIADGQVSRDIDFTQGVELPKMLGDKSYYLDAIATCKGMGLM